MKLSKWRISSNKKEDVETKEQTALITVDQETEKMESGQVVSQEEVANSVDIVEEHTATTWKWNRKKKTWVEIAVKPDEPGSPDATDGADGSNVERYDVSSFFAAPVHRIKHLKSAWKRAPLRGTASRVMDALSSGERIDVSSSLLIQDAEVQAERIIAIAEDRARALADRIVVQAEQRAEERVEGIITRAEETALEKAINIIISAEERAEALAEHIISRAEELAQAKVEKLIALNGGEEQQQTTSVIPARDGHPDTGAGQTIDDTKEIQQQIRAATRQQAEKVLTRMADNELKEITADVYEELKASPGQIAPASLEVEQDEQGMTHTGTAELVVEPPVNYSAVKTVLKRMKMLRGIKVLDCGGSADKGVRIKLRSTNIVRLPFYIMDIPEIEKATILPMETGRMFPWERLLSGANKKNGQPDSRILIKLGKTNSS